MTQSLFDFNNNSNNKWSQDLDDEIKHIFYR
jgi:hypothetical protein